MPDPRTTLRNRPAVQDGSWAIVRGAVVIWSGFNHGSDLLTRGSWKRWWTALLISLAAASALSAFLTVGAQRLAPQRLDDWDARTLRWLEAHGPMSFHDAILLESPGNLSYLIPLTAVVAIIAILRRRPVLAASVVAAYVGMRPIVALGWWMWDRPRPDVILGGAASPPLHSFPSGHIALAISVYGLLAYLWWERSRSVVERTLIVILTAAWCAVVGVARVRLGTHWPSDIIAGAALGIVWVFGVIVALRTAERAGATSTT